jgi:hypothetical protein
VPDTDGAEEAERDGVLDRVAEVELEGVDVVMLDADGVAALELDEEGNGVIDPVGEVDGCDVAD